MKNIITGSVQEKNGKYYAVLNLKDENGKRKLKWISTGLETKGNKKKAQAFLAEKIAEYQSKDMFYTDITVADYFKLWLEDIKLNVRPNTYRSYYGNMMNHIIPYFEKEKIKLYELESYHLNKYYKIKMGKDSKLKTNEPLSATTIRHHHQNISKALADAETNKLISKNPARNATPPKEERYEAQFLNPKQIKDLFILFQDTPIILPVMLSSIYGFRRSEVLGLKWSNIDMENRTIRICETLQQHTGGDYTDVPKTKNSLRTMPMSNSVYELLQKQYNLQNERKRILGHGYKESDYVCTQIDGTPISPNYLSDTFHQLILKSNLPKIRFHDLRHSVASNLLNNGSNIVQVQDWLGHGSPEITLRFYSHVDATSKQQASNLMEELVDMR